MYFEVFATKGEFKCPECNKMFGFNTNHLKTGDKFGTWYCQHCGVGVRGTIYEVGLNIEVDKTDRLVKTLVLLRLDIMTPQTVHIVVPGMMFVKEGQSVEQELEIRNKKHDPYYYDQHTCPSNYLKFPIKEGDNVDPHGLFVHQETILMPEDYDGHLNVKDENGSEYACISAWQKLFRTLN